MPATSALASFGKFRLLGLIGEGGMGVVYRAEMDTPSGSRTVVVKRIRPELARDPSFARMMTQEARLGAQLRHPCLVPVLEAGDIDGELYLVLPYVDGFDLAQILDRAIRVGKQMPVGVACWLALRVAEALEYVYALHDERGKPLVIAHRDVSPSNLMVTRDGDVKLLDFGIAKALDAGDERTRTGTMKGKLAYFSPEQAEGIPLDSRSDLFSLGIVLMEVLLQRRLFRGTSEFDTLRRVREAEIQRPSTLREEIDAGLDRVLLRLMKRDREERFASAHELVAALQPVVHRYGGGAEATRAYLAALGTIERRTSTSTPTSNERPADLEGETIQMAITPVVTEIQTQASPARNRAKATPAPARAAGMPRWKAYLDTLPDGVHSFPSCTIKAAIVHNFNALFGHPPMPPDSPRELRDLVANLPPVSSYASGVLVRLFFLAVADSFGWDDDAFVERVYEGNVQLLAGPLYKMLFMVTSIERLIKNVKSRWAAFHHGIELDVVESDRNHVIAVMRSPPGFEPPLVLRVHATGIRAAVEAVGMRNVRTVIDVVAPGEARLCLSWDPKA